MKSASKLRKFRQQCEREAETSADEIEAPLSHLLHDICKTLKLSGKQRRRVLGRKSYMRLEDTRDCRVDLVRRDS
jgi:hypothetical protein